MASAFLYCRGSREVGGAFAGADRVDRTLWTHQPAGWQCTRMTTYEPFAPIETGREGLYEGRNAHFDRYVCVERRVAAGSSRPAYIMSEAGYSISCAGYLARALAYAPDPSVTSS